MLLRKLTLMITKWKLALTKSRGYPRMFVFDPDLELPFMKTDVDVRRKALTEDLRAIGKKVTTGSVNSMRYIEISIPKE